MRYETLIALALALTTAQMSQQLEPEIWETPTEGDSAGAPLGGATMKKDADRLGAVEPRPLVISHERALRSM